MMEWGKKRGTIIGAMSAPLKFVAFSNDENATIAPTIRVTKIKDTRWLLAVISYILLVIVFNRVEKHIRNLENR